MKSNSFLALFLYANETEDEISSIYIPLIAAHTCSGLHSITSRQMTLHTWKRLRIPVHSFSAGAISQLKYLSHGDGIGLVN